MDAPKKSLSDEDKNLMQDIHSIMQTIDVSEIPISLLKMVKLHIEDKTIKLPIRDWIETGMHPTKIEMKLAELFELHDDVIDESEYLIDFDKVKALVEEYTHNQLYG